MHLDKLGEPVTDAHGAHGVVVPVALPRGELGDLHGRGGEALDAALREKGRGLRVVGAEFLLGLDQRRRFHGKTGAPHDEVGAHVFPRGAGDVDDLGFGDAGPGVGEDEGGEDEPGGQGEAGEQTEEMRTGGDGG